MIQASSTPDAECGDADLAGQIFGQQFEVWAYGGRWHRVQTAGQRTPRQDVDFYTTLINALDAVDLNAGLRFTDLNDGRSLCLFPVPASDGRKLVAVQAVTNDPAALLALAQRATDLAVREHRSTEALRGRLRSVDSQLGEWSSHIERRQPELDWLRSLPASSVLSETDNSSTHVAATILPPLRTLITASSIVFVAHPSEDIMGGEVVNVWQDGDVEVPEAVCLLLVAEHARNAADKSVIGRYDNLVHRTAEFDGVLNCVVRQVVAGKQRIGWILAVNQSQQRLGGDNFDFSDNVVGQRGGFGTFEAGLIEAAADTLASHARNRQLLDEKEALVEGTMRSLVNAIDAKDSYTCGHSDRVAEFARKIAQAMQLDDEFCEQIYMTGLVHDVGKIGVPDDVLQKPGRLTDEEFDSIKQHPVIGHAILKHVKDFEYVLPGVLHHHESVDGSGYPCGLQGGSIPLAARILAVADAYDAMTSDRPYRSGMPAEKAEAIIADGAGTQWDVDCVAAFQSCITGIRRIAHERHAPAVGKPTLQF